MIAPRISPLPLPSCLQPPIRAGTNFKNDYDVLAPGATAAYGEFTATTGLTLPELARASPAQRDPVPHLCALVLLTTRP